MAHFIKLKQGEIVDTEGTPKQYRWTKEELKALYESNPSRFIEVPESHAAAVIRPQGNYQEVDLNVLKPQVKAKAEAPKPATTKGKAKANSDSAARRQRRLAQGSKRGPAQVPES